MTSAPAATRALRVLRFLAAQPQPVAAEHIASAVGMPRASAYRLLAVMAEEGFVVHLEDERTFGLGVAAFEAGSGYTRQAPLQRLARVPLARLVDRTGESAHLAVLHGRDVLYVVEERAPGRPPLVTDVGVRLPAHLTASGRAMLAMLPAAQVRALFPDRAAFVERGGAGGTGTPGSAASASGTPSGLRTVLGETRRRGYAVEEGEVTPGFASVAAAVLDHNRHPEAAVAVTFDTTAHTPAHTTADTTARGQRRGGRHSDGPHPSVERLAGAVRRVADELGRRVRGGRPPQAT